MSRPCGGGCWARSRRAGPAVRSSSGPAGCVTSSSPSSCCSSCTAGPTRRCGRPGRWTPWTRWRRAGTWAARTRRGWRRPTGSCGGSSTCCSYASSGARTPCPRTRRRRASSAVPLPRPPRRRARPGPETARRARQAPHADPAEWFLAEWRRHAGQARELHEKLFYRPLLQAVARLPGEAARLAPEAARARLEALGYADPAGALRHIEALTAGVTRKAAIQRTLLPVLLGWFADAAEPDAGLLAFRQVSEALGDSPWYLRLLRDDTRVAQRLARVLASSRYATGLLLRAPEAVALLADDASLAPRSAEVLRAEAEAIMARHAEASRAAAGILALRRRELLRTAVADLAGLSGIEQTGEALTTIAQVTIAAALDAAIAEAERAAGPLPTRIAVIAMGRLGGHEMGYSSDADVVFVHDPLPGAGEEAAARAAQGVAPRAGRARWSAPSPPTAPTTAAGRSPGKPRRCCGPSRLRAMSRSGPNLPGWPMRSAIRRAAWTPDPFWKYAGSRRGWRPSGCRAARILHCMSSSAPAALPISSGWRSFWRCGTRMRCPACGPPGPWRRWPRPGRRA